MRPNGFFPQITYNKTIKKQSIHSLASIPFTTYVQSDSVLKNNFTDIVETIFKTTAKTNLFLNYQRHKVL